MDAYKKTMKEEMAIRHWQNVISLGTDNSSSQKSDAQQVHKQAAFEVLP